MTAPKSSITSVEMELLLNISISLPVAFAAEARRAEGQFRRFRSTLKNPRSPKFRFGTRRLTVSKRAGQF